MIDKREVIDMATALSLNPHIIEKDFVLGWVLAGIYAHEALADSWLFKGGTCLKKCYFETYRFSEDLDFTLTDESHLDEDFLKSVFTEISAWVYETTGIELPPGLQNFDVFTNPRGRLSCQGKLSYRGPVSPRSGGLPRIKFDLTADECVVLPAARVPIFHPYSDAPDEGIHVTSYAYEEMFAEKVRALAERTRPRDLYDVINLFRNADARPSVSVLLDVLRQKCAYKKIDVPRLINLEPHKSDIEGAWLNMLAHQLPTLPPVDSFWNVLPAFFAWLEEGEEPSVPLPYTLGVNETVIRERSLRLQVSGPSQSYIEIIRFAAANRLCIDLDYMGTTRRVEAYSLRRTLDDNIILHAYDTNKNGHRSYRIDRIEGARTTDQTFSPRYEIELTPQGPIRVMPASRATSGLLGRGRVVHSRRPRQATRAGGPTYVYKCSSCGKKFYRKRQNTALKPHKDLQGFTCYGSSGHWIDTRY